MRKIGEDGWLRPPQKASTSFPRRAVLKALGLSPLNLLTAPTFKATSYNNTDAFLLEIEQKILAAAFLRDRLIARQAEAERAYFKTPDDPERSLVLDVIDGVLDEAHDHVARLADELAAMRVTTLSGFQIKARLVDFGDEISASLRRDILAPGDA